MRFTVSVILFRYRALQSFSGDGAPTYLADFCDVSLVSLRIIHLNVFLGNPESTTKFLPLGEPIAFLFVVLFLDMMAYGKRISVSAMSPGIRSLRLNSGS